MDYLYFGSMIVIALGSAGLALTMRAREDARLTLSWRMAMLSTAVWSFGRAMTLLAGSEAAALAWIKVSYSGSVWLALLWTWTAYELVKRPLPRKTFMVMTALFAVFHLSVFTPYFIPAVKPKMGFPFYDDAPGILFNLWSWTYTACLVWCHVVLFSALRRASGSHRNRIMYFLLAGVLGFGGSTTTFPLVQNVQVYPFGVPIIALFPIVVTFAVVRHRLMDLNLLFRESAVYVFFATLVGIPSLLLMWVTKSVAVASVVAVADVLICEIVFPKVKRRLTEAVDHLPPFRGRYERYKALEKYEAAIRGARTVDEWAHKLAHATAEIFGAAKVNLLYHDPSTESFMIKAGVGFKASSPDLQMLELPTDDPLIHMLERGRVVVREFLDEPGETADPQAVRSRMEFVHAEICVPVAHAGKLLAVLNVGEKKNRAMYNELDLSTLWNLAGVAQGTLWTILSASSQRERNAMWAHDIAHVFGPNGSYFLLDEAVKGAEGPLSESMVTRLKLARNDYEFLRKVYRHVLNAQDYEFFDVKPNSLSQAYTRIKEKYTGIMVRRGLAWTVHTPPEDLKVMCDDLRVEYQVLMNLVENAARYTLRGGEVELGWKRQDGAFEGFIRDTGIGIPQKDLGRIFEGGYHSVGLEERKKDLNPDDRGGRGIGLSSASHVMEKQGGKIWAESVPGRGTTFRFKLPLAAGSASNG